MAEKHKSTVPKVVATYRIPLRSVYASKHVKGDMTWDDVYGKKKCSICNKPFQEGDAYRMSPDNSAYHVECESR